MNKDIFIGVATPQANPTVELEFQRVFKPPVHAMVTRLTSAHDDATTRLLEYLDALPQAVASFGKMPLRAFAFACTASSYLAGHEREEAICEQAEQRFRVQVVTATQAIRRELQGRGAQRIAMVAPYPKSICDAAIRYWSGLGVEIAHLERIDVGDDTHAIYDINPQQVSDTINALEATDADLVLLSGTGMPSLDALRGSRGAVISSNLCLATEMLRRVQMWPPTEAADAARLLAH